MYASLGVLEIFVSYSLTLFEAKNNCNEQYLGCTEQDFRTRMSQHRGYVNNQKLEKAVGYHQISDMEMAVIEKVHKKEGLQLFFSSPIHQGGGYKCLDGMTVGEA